MRWIGLWLCLVTGCASLHVDSDVPTSPAPAGIAPAQPSPAPGGPEPTSAGAPDPELIYIDEDGRPQTLDASDSPDDGATDAGEGAGSGGLGAEPEEVPDTDPSALHDFNDVLDPYGSWVDDPRYGRVWVPATSAVGTKFAPYVTRGHWALTPDSQWIWVSDYPFGWVVFHYGRWAWTNSAGWVWVPGRRYSHAWVTWRISPYGDPFVGWAPMPPAYGWFGGTAAWYSRPFTSSYVFVSTRYVFAPYLRSYVIHEPFRLRRIAARTRRYGAFGNSRYASPPISALGPDRRHAPSTRVPPHPRAQSARRLQQVAGTAAPVPARQGAARNSRPGRRTSSTGPSLRGSNAPGGGSKVIVRSPARRAPPPVKHSSAAPRVNQKRPVGPIDRSPQGPALQRWANQLRAPRPPTAAPRGRAGSASPPPKAGSQGRPSKKTTRDKTSEAPKRGQGGGRATRDKPRRKSSGGTSDGRAKPRMSNSTAPFLRLPDRTSRTPRAAGYGASGGQARRPRR